MRDRGIRAGSNLALKIGEVFLRAARLRVIFGIRRHIDVEPVAGLAPDELDQLARVAKITRVDGAGWQVAPQCDEMANAVMLVAREHLAHAFFRRADTRNMGSRRVTFVADFQHGFQRALARRPSGAESH